MPKIVLHSPVGQEPTQSKEVTPMVDPRGNKVAFLFNGHVSVIPFWKHLEEEINNRFEPESTSTIIKPNTFAPAASASIQELSQADLALVGVCA